MFVFFMAAGLLSPFVWSLAYVWVDTLLPHKLSYSLLTDVPVAFIMGAGAVLSYILMDRKNLPRLSVVHVLCMILAVWITLTETWAVSPVAAWIKWDPSFKTLVFTCFIPFVFRSRVQIEAFVLVMMFSMAAHLLPWGIKTLLSGGGYQLSLGLLGSNSTMLAESSSVAAVATMCVPIWWWMRSHSLLIPWPRIRTLLAGSMTVLYLVANVGTFARTGLIGLGLLGGGMLLRTKRKLLFIVMAGLVGSALVGVMSDRWTDRMETLNDVNNESSAYTRVLVWKWTLGFVAEHPLGGGFDAYRINVIENPPGPNGEVTFQFGRAFHNIFFAALGEHGIPGLILYTSIMGLSVVNMQRVIRKCRDRPDLAWAGDLARATQLGLIILLACGNFVDISFLFLIWDMVALTMCLTNHVQQVLAPRGSFAQAGPLVVSAGRPPMPQYR